VDEAIRATALARGVRPSTVRAALGSGRVRVAADLIGMSAAEVEQLVSALVAEGVGRPRAIELVVLAA
jgi:hypothetical protein